MALKEAETISGKCKQFRTTRQQLASRAPFRSRRPALMQCCLSACSLRTDWQSEIFCFAIPAVINRNRANNRYRFFEAPIVHLSFPQKLSMHIWRKGIAALSNTGGIWHRLIYPLEQRFRSTLPHTTTSLPRARVNRSIRLLLSLKRSLPSSWQPIKELCLQNSRVW